MTLLVPKLPTHGSGDNMCSYKPQRGNYYPWASVAQTPSWCLPPRLVVSLQWGGAWRAWHRNGTPSTPLPCLPPPPAFASNSLPLTRRKGDASNNIAIKFCSRVLNCNMVTQSAILLFLDDKIRYYPDVSFVHVLLMFITFMAWLLPCTIFAVGSTSRRVMKGLTFSHGAYGLGRERCK